ncbi:MAG TPA: 2Fe-2S iron-sulfur cluster-binding protein, partial [Steroidobacter sp.]|nr:2Fe-2S iron-sulfur cluster-binding protein [Steroidobacter sp.]
MARITFVEASGERKEVEATLGESVMRAAINNSVNGIAAECGGCLSCATCHAYVDPEWLARLP